MNFGRDLRGAACRLGVARVSYCQPAWGVGGLWVRDSKERLQVRAMTDMRDGRSGRSRWLAGLVLAGLATSVPALGEERPQSAPFYSDRFQLLQVYDAAGHLVPVRTAQEWGRRREHILAGMQQAMGPWPGEAHRVALEVETLERVDTPQYQRRRVRFTAEPGDRAEGWLLVPHGLKGRAAAVLCPHQTNTVGKDEPAGLGGDPQVCYAHELAARGCVTLAIDYPNYGAYRFDAYAHGYASATMKGLWNHRRGIDLLVSLPEVDAERIGVIGHSLGGHNSLFVAAFDERVKAAVSSCGFCSFRRYYDGNLAGWSHDGYMPRIRNEFQLDPARMPFDFTEVLAAIAPRAVLAVSPVRDGNFAVDGVVECIRAAQPVFALLGVPQRLAVMYPDCEHAFPPEVREAAYAWLLEQLK